MQRLRPEEYDDLIDRFMVDLALAICTGHLADQTPQGVKRFLETWVQEDGGQMDPSTYPGDEAAEPMLRDMLSVASAVAATMMTFLQTPAGEKLA